MAKTWSNRKITEYESPVERNKNRPSSASVFAVALVVISVFFIGLMTYVTVRMETNPPREQIQKNYNVPDEDK